MGSPFEGTIASDSFLMEKTNESSKPGNKRCSGENLAGDAKEKAPAEEGGSSRKRVHERSAYPDLDEGSPEVSNLLEQVKFYSSKQLSIYVHIFSNSFLLSNSICSISLNQKLFPLFYFHIINRIVYSATGF